MVTQTLNGMQMSVVVVDPIGNVMVVGVSMPLVAEYLVQMGIQMCKFNVDRPIIWLIGASRVVQVSRRVVCRRSAIMRHF